MKKDFSKTIIFVIALLAHQFEAGAAQPAVRIA
jgi:hypothetical protein